jgi:hypothetical protein
MVNGLDDVFVGRKGRIEGVPAVVFEGRTASGI